MCLLFAGHLASAQACTEVDLFNTAQKRALLQEYINDCRQKHYFFEDKGIVQLITYQDDKGHICWLVSSSVDNRFLASPAQQYAWLGNDVILIYPGDSKGNIVPISNPTDELKKCVSELVGGRVYDYQPKSQYAYYTDPNGIKKKTAVRHTVSGNVHNELIIEFDNSTIIKKIPS